MKSLSSNQNSDIQSPEKELSIFEIFFITIRPFALPASVIPVIFGTLLVVTIGKMPLKPLNFILALVGMMLLHSGANVLSDINDYKTGLDKTPTPASGGIVRGLITTRQALFISLVLFLLGTICGIILVILSDIFLLPCNIALIIDLSMKKLV